MTHLIWKDEEGNDPVEGERVKGRALPRSSGSVSVLVWAGTLVAAAMKVNPRLSPPWRGGSSMLGEAPTYKATL